MGILANIGNDPGGFGLATRAGQLQGVLASLHQGLGNVMDEGKQADQLALQNREQARQDEEFKFRKSMEQQQLDALKSYRSMQISDTQRRLGDFEQKNANLQDLYNKKQISLDDYRTQLNGIRTQHIAEMAEQAKAHNDLVAAHNKAIEDLGQAKFNEKVNMDAQNYLLNSDKFENTKQQQKWKQAFDTYGQQQGEKWKQKTFDERRNEFEQTNDFKRIQQSDAEEKQVNLEKQQGIDNARKSGAEEFKRQHTKVKPDTNYAAQAQLKAEKDADEREYKLGANAFQGSDRATWTKNRAQLYNSANVPPPTEDSSEPQQ